MHRYKDEFEIDVLSSGAVILGPDVTCDGFQSDRQVRVQTHTHSDHMSDFQTSKGRELVMSRGVRDLLLFDNPDFDFRSNIHVLEGDQTYLFGRSRIGLIPAGHMLGASQVAVEMNDGSRLGYSGDFSWPLIDVIRVDALVIDATYGHPESNQAYPQHKVEQVFVELVRTQIDKGPVHLMANSAVIERALMILGIADLDDFPPIIANRHLCSSINVHRAHGWQIAKPVSQDEPEGHAILGEGRYVRCWKLFEGGRSDGIIEGTTINLTKYRAAEPIVQHSENGFTVGLSNHASFSDTLEYVEKTGAEFVITDNFRGKNNRGQVLANYIENELGIVSKASSNVHVQKW